MTDVRRWLAARRTSLVWLAPVLGVVGAVHALGMASYPAFSDDEGTYMAQAWAVQAHHALSPYTYWYDHPPLGWMLLAGWNALVGGFEHAPSDVVIGRQAMLVVNLVSCVLVFVVARRLGFRRVAAATAVALFALSPLAVAYQRMVFLDNISVMW